MPNTATWEERLRSARFEFEGGRTGVLLLHGYTGAPTIVRPMGEYLASKGLHVVAPLLPGHGTSPADLNTKTWREVAEAARAELYTLQGSCDRVFVAGLSMGGLLSLHLAAHCSDITGVIPMAAAVYLKSPLRFLIPVVRHLTSTFPKSNDPHLSIEDLECEDFLYTYDREPVQFAAEVMKLVREVRENLHRVHQPLLVFQGTKDKTVPMKAAHAIIERTSSKDKELVRLEQSGHCLTVDGERDQVFAKTWQWIEAH